MNQTCLECFNLRAKIPLVGEGNILPKRMFFAKATVWCREGHLTVSNPKGSEERDRVFKNVLALPTERLAFAAAGNCPDFDGEEEKV